MGGVFNGELNQKLPTIHPGLNEYILDTHLRLCPEHHILPDANQIIGVGASGVGRTHIFIVGVGFVEKTSVTQADLYLVLAVAVYVVGDIHIEWQV